jgi:hypothetical protein
MPWIEVLRRAREQAAEQPAHPWAARLERLRGTVDNDGVERITTQAVFDVLEVPQRARTAAACSLLARLMRGMGWMPIRTRRLTRGGFKDQVRGYGREGQHQPPPPPLPDSADASSP